MQKIRDLWNRLPKEVKVAIYVTVSGALAELVKYLEVVQVNDLVLAGIINIVVVLIKNRNQVIISRFKK